MNARSIGALLGLSACVSACVLGYRGEALLDTSWDLTGIIAVRIDLPSKFAKGGSIPGVRAPITINGERMAADRAPPTLGEHTAEVLAEIGEAS